MTAPIPSTAPPAAGSARLEAVFFALGVVYLLLLAGVIHRAVSPTVSEGEVLAMYLGLLALWPFFAVEASLALVRLAPGRSWWPALGRTVLILLLPPYRMGRRHPISGLVWFPRLGWVSPGKETFDRIDRGFGTPMLFVALLILPVLILEYTQADLVKQSPGLSLALDIGIAVIWVAFALEFLLESSVAPKAGKYLKEKWLDAAIVILPMLEFVLTKLVDAAPLARLLRLGRALSPEQLARMQKLYRLRGLLMKAWAAFLLMGGLNRLFGQAAQKRLRIVEERMTELEAELAELRKEADELRAKVAAEDATGSEAGATKPL